MLVIGLIIGASIGVIFMCILQINRDSKLKVRIKKATEKLNDLKNELSWLSDTEERQRNTIITLKLNIILKILNKD